MSDPFLRAPILLPLSTCRSSPIRRRAARCSSASATSGGRRRTGSDSMTIAGVPVALQRVDGRLHGAVRRLGEAWRPGAALTAPATTIAAGSNNTWRGRADDGRHVDALGRDVRRAACSSRRTPTPTRRARSSRGWTTLRSKIRPVRQRHPHRFGQPEPRVGLVQRLQCLDARDTGARVLVLQPGHGNGRVDGPRSYDFGDIPVTDVAATTTGDLYASSDFGVRLREVGTTSWTLAGSGMPNLEVAGLTIVPGNHGHGHGHHGDGILYAASHGLGAWKLQLGHGHGGH